LIETQVANRRQFQR